MTKSSFDLIAPAGYVWSVTPSDTDDMSMETRAIRVGTAGDITILAYDPATNKLATVTIPDVVAGEVLMVRTTRVYSTGTTASGFTAYA